MKSISIKEQWVCGHQPVSNFHTGLVSKIYKTTKEGGLLILHDLDSLEEKGSCAIKIPTARGDDTDYRLIQKAKKKNLFSYGPVHISDMRKLIDIIKSWTGKHINKSMMEEVAERIEKFQKYFPPEQPHQSVGQLNRDILSFVLPRIGIRMPRSEFFSKMLPGKEWTEALVEVADELHKERGLPLTIARFWFWDNKNHFRIRMKEETSIDDLKVLLKEHLAIPKALPFSMVLQKLKCSVIKGLGQEEYEKEYGMKPNGKPSMVVTSQQGVPPAWKTIAPKGFRPSALLLWILGGQFDHEKIISH